MINKPVNAFPYNVCVNANKPFNIGYELPHSTKIDGAYISIKNLQGDEIWSDYKNLDGVSSISSVVPMTIDTNGEDELSWNSFYWSSLDEGSYSVKTADKPTITSDDGDSQICLMPNASTIEEFKSRAKNMYVEHIGSAKGDSGYVYVIDGDNRNVVMPEMEFLFEHYNEWAVGVHFEWNDVQLSYSSFTTLDEAKEYKKNSEYVMCCVCAPSEEILVWAQNNKSAINSEEFVLKLTDGKGDISFFGVIDNYLYNDDCTYVYDPGGGNKIDDGIDYMIFFLQKCTSYNNVKKVPLYFQYYKHANGVPYLLGESLGDMAVIESIEICSVFSSPVSDGDYLMLNSQPKIILNSKINEGRCYINIEPSLTENELNSIYSLQNLGFFKTSPNNANTTQNFYFRYKSAPTLSVVNASEPDILSEGNYEEVIVEPVKQVNDVKCEFGISYESQHKLNYFYLYLMGYDVSINEWNLLSSSEMLNKATDTHIFDGLMDGNEYAVYCVCYDIDGDEWQSDEYRFVVSNAGETSDKIDSDFNHESMVVEISIQKLIPIYKNLHIDFYKEEVNAAIKPQLLKYAGGGYCKTGGENDTVNGVAIFNVLRDYNVRNNTEYQYYAKISYDGRNYDDDGNKILDDATSGTAWFKIPDTIITDFAGTSVMGLSERYDNVYEITNEFKILYQRESHEDTINYELSRDYADTVGKYSYEIRGSQNYKTGECTGLLGYCLNGDYIEPALLSDKWQRFVNGDGIKLYRGLNGETLIISIESTKIAKPTYANVRRVSAVTFTFREIADANNYVVYETELVEG